MQAITVKYMGPTNTLGVRLKAVSDAGSLTESRKYEMDVRDQARYLAERFIVSKTWSNCIISGQGTLPNGDEVFTLASK